MLPEYNKPKGMSDLVKAKMENLRSYNKMAEGGEAPSEDSSDCEACAAEAILAVDKRDPKLFLKAMYALFEMFDSMPHDEGEVLKEESNGPGALLITGEI
jgi:hypothetical protein